jgi:predicted outer membrane repeat protein
LVVGIHVGSSADGATWHITADGLGDAPTIQAGIVGAVVGDTVLVGPGTYNEQIDFLGKDIVVRGEFGAASTVLDGTGLGTFGVTFQNGESRLARLQDLTVKNSKRGVFIFEAEPTIIQNIITDNGGLALYAGIVCTGNGGIGPWSPLIQENEITNNQSGWTGPGIAAQKKMIPEIVDNYIAGNRAGIGDGGGIYIRTEFSGTIIRGNRIENNYAGDHGGGIYVAGLVQVGIEISDNIIWNNTADGGDNTGESGGGIWLQEASAWIHHNTIVANTGNGPVDTWGGGIAMHIASSPLVEQNIIALSANGGGIFCHTNVTPTIRNNLGWQNLPVEGVGLCADWWQSDGNVIADPWFCDAGNGDFSLAEGSPALVHAAGPLGAIPTPGCQPTVVERLTWGRIKSLSALSR